MTNIGVFDSGLGGLWILKYLEENLPGYHYIYYADQTNLPYGSHIPEEITQFSRNITNFLIEKDCKIIVIACNTATSAAITKLREEYSLPFVGIEPAVKPASENSKTGHIGVLATKVTVEGQKLQDSIDKFAGDIKVHTVIGYGLVELVENGEADTDKAEELLREYIQPLLEKGIDQLVLGCTHYAFLMNRIKNIVGDRVNIVDPAPAVVRRVKQLVNDTKIIIDKNSKGTQLFTSSSDIKKLESFYNSL